MTVRIRMPKGHLELNLAGHTFKPDEDGAFLVPDDHAKELIAVHGAVIEPSVQDYEADAAAADLLVAQAKQRYDASVEDAKAAHLKVERAKQRKKAQASEAPK